jgi:poly(hydroxyalkanoate) granule-associated protein
MVKQVNARKAASKRTPDFTARELWLASLGAASLTRKQGIKLYDAMVEEGNALQGKVNQAVADARSQVDGALCSVRERIDGVVAPVRERAEATFVVLKDEVETRLQPVLARFGKVKPAAKRAPAKRRAAPSARKVTAKRTRKAA